jgi:hypothetical protein
VDELLIVIGRVTESSSLPGKTAPCLTRLHNAISATPGPIWRGSIRRRHQVPDEAGMTPICAYTPARRAPAWPAANAP